MQQFLVRLLNAGGPLQLYFLFFFNWDSLYARLSSHYKTWSHKKKKHKIVKAYRKSVQKKPTVKRRLLILDLKPLRSQVIKPLRSFYRQRIPESSCLRKETVDIDILVTSRNSDLKIEQTSLKNKEVEPVEPVQMNIYQYNIYRTDLSLLHFDNEPRVSERK